MKKEKFRRTLGRIFFTIAMFFALIITTVASIALIYYSVTVPVEFMDKFKFTLLVLVSGLLLFTGEIVVYKYFSEEVI